jgi:hypothetical protein
MQGFSTESSLEEHMNPCGNPMPISTLLVAGIAKNERKIILYYEGKRELKQKRKNFLSSIKNSQLASKLFHRV